MNTLRMAEKNGEFTVDDQVVTARIYAKEVEHSEWNLEYMADEFLFGEAYTPDVYKRQIFICHCISSFLIIGNAVKTNSPF